MPATTTTTIIWVFVIRERGEAGSLIRNVSTVSQHKTESLYEINSQRHTWQSNINTSPLKPRTSEGCLLPPLSFKGLEILANIVRYVALGKTRNLPFYYF